MRRDVVFPFFAAAIAFAGAARAAPPAVNGSNMASQAMPFSVAPVSDTRLMNMRGGFDLGNGLIASFGISRLIYIDGNLVAHTSVNIPDLSHLSSTQAQALASALASIDIRNGVGNSVSPGAAGAPGTILIQNSLDNQKIRAMTTINATVKDLSTFNAINFSNGLQSAVNSSTGH